ncbi:hypothetical protein IQ249_24665 [Lusitaniella coriacea LEGE 07157]|uniref:Uncharacterized protein n=1 Tax=Lusitaniella coriacea LEGE 07157 TaxID=945747 RepID=A0A8J7IY01_9CYAN|nr:hypothetical protein [Lusitaniella coriacea]MBE9119053.1 hypothetical protein [Lusitaniella coriacea LEGE 07157]
MKTLTQSNQQQASLSSLLPWALLYQPTSKTPGRLVRIFRSENEARAYACALKSLLPDILLEVQHQAR